MRKLITNDSKILCMTYGKDHCSETIAVRLGLQTQTTWLG